MFKKYMPAWTAGWRVLTLPPNISGAPVSSDTSLQRTTQFSCKIIISLSKFTRIHYNTIIKKVEITYFTGILAFLMVFAVPPDATNCNPKLWSFWENWTNPLLSDTLKIAKKSITLQHRLYKTSETVCWPYGRDPRVICTLGKWYKKLLGSKHIFLLES